MQVKSYKNPEDIIQVQLSGEWQHIELCNTQASQP
jgi:hypothetical protein